MIVSGLRRNTLAYVTPPPRGNADRQPGLLAWTTAGLEDTR